MCDEATTLQRLIERGGGTKLHSRLKDAIAWRHDHQDIFDLTVDRGKHARNEVTRLIYDAVKT